MQSIFNTGDVRTCDDDMKVSSVGLVGYGRNSRNWLLHQSLSFLKTHVIQVQVSFVLIIKQVSLFIQCIKLIIFYTNKYNIFTIISLAFSALRLTTTKPEMHNLSGLNVIRPLKLVLWSFNSKVCIRKFRTKMRFKILNKDNKGTETRLVKIG